MMSWFGKQNSSTKKKCIQVDDLYHLLICCWPINKHVKMIWMNEWMKRMETSKKELNFFFRYDDKKKKTRKNFWFSFEIEIESIRIFFGFGFHGTLRQVCLFAFYTWLWLWNSWHFFPIAYHRYFYFCQSFVFVFFLLKLCLHVFN